MYKWYFTIASLFLEINPLLTSPGFFIEMKITHTFTITNDSGSKQLGFPKFKNHIHFQSLKESSLKIAFDILLLVLFMNGTYNEMP